MSVFDKKEEPSIIKRIIDEKTKSNKKRSVSIELVDSKPMVKSINDLFSGQEGTVERLAFEINPRNRNAYSGLYRTKERLLPDEVIKRIAMQNDLVATIANARAFHLSSMGRPQPDRHSTGFRIEPEPGLTERLSDKEKQALRKQIKEAELRILTCGRTGGYTDEDVQLFSQFLWQTGRQAVLHGRIAVEAIPSDNKFHSFRAIDVGTVYKVIESESAKRLGDGVRKQALKEIEKLKDVRLDPSAFEADEYSWIQVIENTPVQAFSAEECLVHSFYPVLDIELGGYPLTPLDTVITAVATHLNISSHNKLYFQSGRAARGMLVVKSDDIDEGTIQKIRQQFQASINSVQNSWRMPIFGIGPEDSIEWHPVDGSGRDMEFQYLSDSNARTILSAFQMSPEEIPGYAHLSRGSNNQALSESNNEYKLEAHRDVGLRPLIAAFQDFINYRILPLIDEDLSKKASFKFVGLDAETAEKETVRLQQDLSVHLTMNEALERVEKKPIPKQLGGDFMLNPAWQAALDKYVPVGVVMEYFFGIENASKDPKYAFVNNPLYFQNLQMLQQQQMMEQQMQAQQAQPQQQRQPQAQQGGQEDGEQDLTRSLDQLATTLNKSEMQLSPSKRRLLAQQRQFVQHTLRALEEESKDAIKEILDVAEKSLPNKLKKKGK